VGTVGHRLSFFLVGFWRNSFSGGGSRGRWGLLSVVLISLATLSGLFSGAAQAASVTAARPSDSSSSGASVAVLDVVMLVDESGSETPAKVAAEKQTAGTIVQTMLNPRSRVTVIGFGGVNNITPGQNPVDVVCQPTIAGGQANLDYLASCVGKLHRRTENEGDDTDYAAALNEAMSYLSPGSTATPASPSNAIKVILMMTDGAVDVARNTQQYGTDWRLGEQTAINQQLSEAKADDVQLWPLGFGADVGTGVTQAQAKDYLNQMASSGAPAVCNTRQAANQPHATWVNDPTDAINALNQLYMDAACLGGGTVTGPSPLTVSIPAIASSAAISVDRVNPAISVTFKMPDGSTWTDASAISGADANSPVEVLHLSSISQADVGKWQIDLTAPQNLAHQLYSVTVFWQGAVRAIITATPSVKPGQPIAVKLTVLGPTGPITDPGTLKSLQVGVTATGQGLSSPVGIPVTALTGASNTGSYAGSYTAPSQPTTLTITGIASGYGLYATKFPATVAVGLASEGFVATPHFNGVTSVGAGGTLGGTIDFTNQTGRAKQVLLKLTADGTTASVSPTTPITVPSQASGNPPSVPFTVTIGKQAGLASLELQVIDASTGQVYNTVADEIQVTTPPPWYIRYLGLIIGVIIALALIIGGLLAVRARRRYIRGVNDLTAILRRDGAELGAPLRAPQKWSDTFTFIIHDEGGRDPRLDWPQPGVPVYRVKRSGNGMVRLLTPTNDSYDIVVGSPGERLEHNGLELAFRDRRRARARGGGGKTPPPQRVSGVPPVVPSDPLDPFYQPQAQNPTRLDPVDFHDQRATGGVADLHDQRTMDVPYPPPAQYPSAPSASADDDDWLH
jgi:von Willebrand factor type A domain